MERCDFSSISTCLKNQISESNQMNQPDFLYELFEDFMNDPINEDFSMDNGLICRWITGQAKISPKITSYYAKPSNQKKLATTIQRNLLPLMADCNMVIQDIYTLFIQDDTISDTKKQELVSLYKPSDSRLLFLAKVLSFGMERQFIKRDTRNQDPAPCSDSVLYPTAEDPKQMFSMNLRTLILSSVVHEGAAAKYLLQISPIVSPFLPTFRSDLKSFSDGIVTIRPPAISSASLVIS